MFAWSRLEIAVAVVLAALIVVGGAGQLLWAAKEGVRPIVVEAREAARQEVEGHGDDVAGDGHVLPRDAEVFTPDTEVMARQADKSRPVTAEGGDQRAAFERSDSADGTTGDGRTGDENAGMVDERININIAPPSELQRLPGIGPALAARIVEYRERWGPFDNIEDIMEVSGIGPVKFANMKHLIKVR